MTVGSSKGRRRARWGIAALVLIAACRKSAPATSPDSATMSSGTVDELAAAQAELVGNADALRALGVVVGEKGTKARDFDDGERRKQEPSPVAPEAEPLEDEVSPGKPSPISPPPKNAPPPAPPKAATTAAPDACGRICALAGAACDLSQRICTLAEQHDGDARYEDLCWNAQRQCEAASDACSDCSTC